MMPNAVAIRDHPSPRRGAGPAVLIQVPSLRGSSHARSRRSSPTPPRRRRRLRREVRIAGLLTLVACPAAILASQFVVPGPPNDVPTPRVILSTALEPVVLRDAAPTDDDPTPPPAIHVETLPYVTAEPPEVLTAGGDPDARN